MSDDPAFGRITTAEGKSTRGDANPQHLSTGLAGRSRHDARDVESREADPRPSRTTAALGVRA